jgi:hypothetical protein
MKKFRFTLAVLLVGLALFGSVVVRLDSACVQATGALLGCAYEPLRPDVGTGDATPLIASRFPPVLRGRAIGDDNGGLEVDK